MESRACDLFCARFRRAALELRFRYPRFRVSLRSTAFAYALDFVGEADSPLRREEQFDDADNFAVALPGEGQPSPLPPRPGLSPWPGPRSSQTLPLARTRAAAQVSARQSGLSNNSQNFTPKQSCFFRPAVRAAVWLRSRIVCSRSITTTMPGIRSNTSAMSPSCSG